MKYLYMLLLILIVGCCDGQSTGNQSTPAETKIGHRLYLRVIARNADGTIVGKWLTACRLVYTSDHRLNFYMNDESGRPRLEIYIWAPVIVAEEVWLTKEQAVTMRKDYPGAYIPSVGVPH